MTEGKQFGVHRGKSRFAAEVQVAETVCFFALNCRICSFKIEIQA
jgi:hypothetical protein